MELKGSRVISADRATVWAALNDPEVLKACIPGCTELSGSPEEGFEAKVTQKVGPVKANFAGAVQLSDIIVEESYTIGGTELTYEVDAKIGGKLAQLGSRLIDSFSKKMADQFFETFQKVVEGDGSPDADAPEEEKKGWLKKVLG